MIKQNIPYQMGQRNAYYEMALRLLQKAVAEIEKLDLMQIAKYVSSENIKDNLIKYLNNAYQSARYIKNVLKDSDELHNAFCEYLGLLLEEAHTIAADATMHCMLEEEKGCLGKMGIPLQDIMLYEPYENQHIKDKLKTIRHFLEAGYEKYKELQTEEQSFLSTDEEKRRYTVSYNSIISS